MSKEPSNVDYLARSDNSKKETKFDRKELAEILKIVVTCTVFLIIVSATPLFSPLVAGAKGDEEPKASLEGFSLLRYETDLSWKLSGKKASKDDELLLVREFELTVRKKDSGTEEPIYKFSGEKIRLRYDDKENVAVIPEKVEIVIENELEGTARGVKFDFSTGKVSGDELNLTQTGTENGISLEGAGFEYDYESNKLVLTEAFRIEIDTTNGKRLEITGDQLTWIRGDQLHAEGDVLAKTNSGWELTAGEMSWDPSRGILKCSGPVLAVKGVVRVEGKALTYSRDNEEIDVRGATMVMKGK